MERSTIADRTITPVRLYICRQKWEQIGFFTTRIDRQSVTAAVKAAYLLSGVREPEILFFDSPFEPWCRDFLSRFYLNLEHQVELRRKIENKLEKPIERLKNIGSEDRDQIMQYRKSEEYKLTTNYIK